LTFFRDVQVSGRCRLVATPTLGRVPFAGGLQICFLSPPKIDFDLDGLADIADWPGLRRKVRAEIAEDTAKRCVYPNRLCVQVRQSVLITTLMQLVTWIGKKNPFCK
jgi:Ca2+-dependent lipid-binding protein